MTFAVHIHLPNIYVGGIEQWALGLIYELPEYDWTVSTPAGAISHPVARAEFQSARIVDENEISPGVDLLLACCHVEAPVDSKRVVAVAHGTHPYYCDNMQRLRHAHAVAVSDVARTAFESCAAVTVIRNGVRLHRLRRSCAKGEMRQRLGIDESATVLGYVGRWSDAKNPLAAALAASQIENAVALYVGTGPDEERWKSQARTLANCRFVRPEEAAYLADYYTACDACVFASHSEGFGLSIAEAWFCETPVISTRVGIANEHPDFITEVPFDPTATELRRAVFNATKHDRKTLRAARAAVLTHYTSERMAAHWKRLIDSLCGA